MLQPNTYQCEQLQRETNPASRAAIGIVWNEDLDLSEYELWKNGVAVAASDMKMNRGDR